MIKQGNLINIDVKAIRGNIVRIYILHYNNNNNKHSRELKERFPDPVSGKVMVQYFATSVRAHLQSDTTGIFVLTT